METAIEPEPSALRPVAPAAELCLAAVEVQARERDLVRHFQKEGTPYGDESPELFALGSGLDGVGKVLDKAKLPALAQFMDWGYWDDDYSAASAKWFEATEGLAVVRQVAAYLRAKPKALGWSDNALAELEVVEAALTAAAARKVPFHFQLND